MNKKFNKFKKNKFIMLTHLKLIKHFIKFHKIL